MGPASSFSSWNYRIIENEEGGLSIHEVYYDDMGVVCDWTERGIAPYGENMQELNTDFNMMQEAFYYPVLKSGETEDGDSFLMDHPEYMPRIEITTEEE